MSESFQAVLGLLMIVGVFGSIMVFVNDRVNWSVFSGLLTLAIGSLGLLLWSLFRRDKAPDFLKSIQGRLLERDHFCFKVIANPVKGRCYLDLHFQSRYERPSRAMVVLQPSKGFFLTRPDVAGMTVEIECPAGGYGVTSVPWPIAKTFQGKTQLLDVGADVRYPEGKGKMIRFRGGLQVAALSGEVWRATIMTVAAAMGGMIVLLSKRAKVKLKLPVDVEESVADDLPITTKIVWKLGDAPDQSLTKKSPATDLGF
jgi:hypothetical protein